MKESPVIVFEARPPVGRPQQRLNSTGQINKQVTHEKKPAKNKHKLQLLISALESRFIRRSDGKTDMERIGATASREAMRIPISQIPAVSSRAQVGSPLALPWPNTWNTCTRSHDDKGNMSALRRTGCWIKPAGKVRCHLVQWPATVEERRSDSEALPHSRKRMIQSQWPTEKAMIACL